MSKIGKPAPHAGVVGAGLLEIKVGGTVIGEIVPPDMGHGAPSTPTWGIGPWTIGHGAPDMAKPAVPSGRSCRTAPTLEDFALQKL